MYFDESTCPGMLAGLSVQDEAAWDRLVSKYGPWIYDRCRIAGLSDEDAEELSQDVFVLVFRKFRKFSGIGGRRGFRRWLVTLVNNRMRDFFRVRQRRVQTTNNLSGYPHTRATYETTDSVADDVVQDRAMHVIRIIQADCGERRWRAFWMTVGLEMQPTAVAEELGMTPGAVRQAKYSICRRLRDEWRSYNPGTEIS
ncbi:MAG: sigma-70 family RNA polymerase sigma factor [Planctomycetaceae bacterium]|nr:sigma-70 family RNA polymerase sigma factor [Planctomycetaceae bacterium]